jgi:hypothetical protein
VKTSSGGAAAVSISSAVVFTPQTNNTRLVLSKTQNAASQDSSAGTALLAQNVVYVLAAFDLSGLSSADRASIARGVSGDQTLITASPGVLAHYQCIFADSQEDANHAYQMGSSDKGSNVRDHADTIGSTHNGAPFDPHSGQKLSVGEILGIVGGLGLVVLIAGTIVHSSRRKRQRAQEITAGTRNPTFGLAS